MTRAAGIRTHITGDVRLGGTILRRYSFALEIAQRNQCENACGCNRCDNEQPLPPGSRQLRHNFQDRYYEKRAAPGKPAAYQFAYIDALQRELDDVTKQFDQFLAQDLPALNDSLKSRGQQPNSVPSAKIGAASSTGGLIGTTAAGDLLPADFRVSY
jgi:hypothetical protein